MNCKGYSNCRSHSYEKYAIRLQQNWCCSISTIGDVDYAGDYIANLIRGLYVGWFSIQDGSLTSAFCWAIGSVAPTVRLGILQLNESFLGLTTPGDLHMLLTRFRTVKTVWMSSPGRAKKCKSKN